MSCENCGSAQLPGALYCIHCGHPFPGECPECGFANPPDARFCGGCRRSLSGGAVDTEGERRPLTFLFCDLVDSTALFEQLDPEDVRQVQNAVRRLFSKLAAMHDGYVAEYVGDGVVLYFGYPQAQENDPERAVRCGLAMARQVGSVRRTMRLSAPLAVRVAHPHGPGHARPGQPRRRPPLGGVRRRDQHHRQAAEERPAGRGRRNGRDLGVDARVLHRALTRAGRAGRGVPADHRMAGGERGPGARLGRRAAHRRSVRGPRTRTTPRRRALASGHRGRDAFRPPSR